MYKPDNKDELKDILNKLDQREWSKIDTSNIKDMSNLFRNKNLSKADISGWDVSKVKNMDDMFLQNNPNYDRPHWYKKW